MLKLNLIGEPGIDWLYPPFCEADASSEDLISNTHKKIVIPEIIFAICDYSSIF